MTTGSSPPRSEHPVRMATFISYYGLIVFFGVLSLQALDSIRFTTLVIWFLQVLPLLPFAPGLHRNNPRVSMWLSLVVMLYFVHGVQVAFDPARTWQGILEATICVILFACLMAMIRISRVSSANEKSGAPNEN